MKINSNTVYITKESSEYGELENVIKKIASENEVGNVESIQISLSSDEGVIGFKVAQDAPTQGMPTQDTPLVDRPEKEQTDWSKIYEQKSKKRRATNRSGGSSPNTNKSGTTNKFRYSNCIRW